ncbi:DNA photolyase, FAD-binding/Cryptochrome, partial [Mucidula mucida]
FLIYILRNDLRLADNPIFHAILTRAKAFSHVLPIFILPPSRIEVSGLATDKSPYPDARSRLGNFWRCGPHRVKFLAEAIFDVRSSLRAIGSDLVIRVGPLDVVVDHLLKSDAFRGKSGAVWMTRDWATEEMAEERRIRNVVHAQDGNVEWKVWDGEDTLIHDDDLPVKPSQLPDVFTSFRKSVEPLRDHVRQPLSLPPSVRLPPLPDSIPGPVAPFTIPDSLPELITALQKPLLPVNPVPGHTAHPFTGGESHGRKRVLHLLSSGAMSRYKDTRNGLLGEDFSTKLSGYLALGCITARQINELVVAFEDGTMPSASSAVGYGKGENKGTSAVRFELLWRDYMRLCMRKYGASLFSVYGFHGHQRGRSRQTNSQWRSPSADMETAKKFERFLDGTTGIGLIDASMRELALTGYTSNRARQNCASFLATWLGSIGVWVQSGTRVCWWITMLQTIGATGNMSLE